ncbi:MAG: ECF-type sigma factor [Isosphaeraceae bacterium]
MALLERSGRSPPVEWEPGRPHDDTPSRPVPRHSAHHHIQGGGQPCKQNRPGRLAIFLTIYWWRCQFRPAIETLIVATQPVYSIAIPEITHLMDAAAPGDRQAAADLLPLVCDGLRQHAAARVAAGKPEHTINPTALVHEAYLRTVGNQHFESRGCFCAAGAEAMRRVLGNHARDCKRLKSARAWVRLELLDQSGSLAEDPDLVLSLDELLTRLGAEDAAAARVAHLHLFGGLSVVEAGAEFEISRVVAHRNWKHRVYRRHRGYRPSRCPSASDCRLRNALRGPPTADVATVTA